MAVTDTWAAGNSFAASDADNVARAINGSGWLQPCHFATTGTESFTVSGGSVTSIGGTTLDGGLPSVNDRILIKDAPSSTGTGQPLSNVPPNGVYTVTGVSTNLTVARVYEMSVTPPQPYFPGGWVVAVMAGTINAGLTYIVKGPSNPAASFTYGTNAVQFAPNGYLPGTGLTLTGSTLGLSSASQASLAAANTALQSASNVLTTSGTVVQVSPMLTGQIIYGSGGIPTIGILGGDLTLSSTGAATVNAGSISTTKMANLAANSVLGNATASSATPTAVPISRTGAASSLVMTTVSGTVAGTSFSQGLASITTSGGTTTLVAGSGSFLQFTGTANHTCVLPDATTLPTGIAFTITNRSTGAITVQASGATTLQTMAAGSQCVLTLIANSTAAGTWDVAYTIAGLAGTLTGVSIANSNGFAGASSGGATPVLTLQTTVTGLLKGNGTAVSAAVSGTDYAPATTTTSILKGNGSGGFLGAISGSDYAPPTPAGVHALASTGVGGFQTATLNNVATPTANYPMGGYTFTGLASPTSSDQAANKGYVDTVVQGLSSKSSAVAATNTETLTITSGSVSQIAGTTVDGFTPAVGDYILIFNAPASSGAALGSTQSSLTVATANGLYQVTGNTTNLTVIRAASMSGSINPNGAFCFVVGGNTFAANGYVAGNMGSTGTVLSPDAPFTYGTSYMSWVQFSGAGEINTGPGLTLYGNTLGLNLIAGTAISITNNSSTIAVANNSIGTNQLSASGTTNSTTYLRGDNTWTSFNSSVGAALTGGTGINFSNGTISVATASLGPTQLSATGTASSSTFLRGDNTWAPLSVSGVSLSSLNVPTANISWGGYGITNLANPVNAQDAVTKIYSDSTGYYLYCRAATTGLESYTISGGTVTQIAGTTIDGVSLSVNDRVLIKDAPASTGLGSILSAQPGNGIYIVTANTTNLTLSRVADMSSGAAHASPAGGAVLVVAGSANSVTSWKIASPTGGAFTYGSTAIQWAPAVNVGSGLVRSGSTLSVATAAQGTALLGTTIASGKSFAVNNSITLAGTDGTTFTYPASSDTVVTQAATQTLTNKTLSATTNTFVNIPNSALAGAPGSTIVGINDTQTLTNKTLVTPTISGYTENATAVTVGASYVFSLASFTVFNVLLTANTACTFTMPAVGSGLSFTVFMRQPATTGGGSGSFSGVEWGWPGTPTIPTAVSSLDIYNFVSDGTHWYGTYLQGFSY